MTFWNPSFRSWIRCITLPLLPFCKGFAYWLLPFFITWCSFMSCKVKKDLHFSACLELLLFWNFKKCFHFFLLSIYQRIKKFCIYCTLQRHDILCIVLHTFRLQNTYFIHLLHLIRIQLAYSKLETSHMKQLLCNRFQQCAHFVLISTVCKLNMAQEPECRAVHDGPIFVAAGEFLSSYSKL